MKNKHTPFSIKRAYLNLAIFMMLLYMFKNQINYFDFRAFLPEDLFRYPYTEMSRGEVGIWKLSLNWVVPGVIVFFFMRWTHLSTRVKESWGTTLVGVIVFIKLFAALLRIPFAIVAATIPGGGALFVVNSLYGGFLNLVHLPLEIGLLVGCVKIFMDLMPKYEKRNAATLSPKDPS